MAKYLSFRKGIFHLVAGFYFPAEKLIVVHIWINKHYAIILRLRKLPKFVLIDIYRIEKLMQTGHKFIIYNAIPSTRKNKPNTAFPSYGNCKERNEITMLFNKFSQNKCTSLKIIFKNTYNLFTHKNGLTNRKFYKDRIHLSQRALLPTMTTLEKSLTGFVFKLPNSRKNICPSTRGILREILLKFGF